MWRILMITVIILTMDMIWLTSTMATSRRVFAGVQGKPMSVRLEAAVAAYVLMIAAVWIFAVRPASGWQEAAALGAALGFCVYGVYDMTNYAVLAAYPLNFAITDMVWGTTLFGVTAGLTYAAAEYMKLK